MHVASLKMMMLWLVEVVYLNKNLRFHCENCRTPGSFAVSRFLNGSLRLLGPRFSDLPTTSELGHASSTRTTFCAARVLALAKSCSCQRNITTLPIAGGFTSFQIWNDGGLCARHQVCARQNLGIAGISTDRFVCQEAAGSSVEPEWSHREHLRTRSGRSNSHIVDAHTFLWAKRKIKKKWTLNINLEPVCPLFWCLNPPKHGLF